MFCSQEDQQLSCTYAYFHEVISKGFFSGKESTVEQLLVQQSDSWTSKCETCQGHTRMSKLLNSSDSDFSVKRAALQHSMQSHFALMRAERSAYYDIRSAHGIAIDDKAPRTLSVIIDG